MADLYVVNGVLIDKDQLDEGLLFWDGWSSLFSAPAAPGGLKYLSFKRLGFIGGGLTIMYPKNAASPPEVCVGAVVQISDGAVQTTGTTTKVKVKGGSWTAAGGTTAFGDGGTATYIPSQAETNYEEFLVEVYKTGCIPASATVVTTDTATAGRVNVSHIAGTSQTGRDIGASVLLSSGTGTGQLDFTSGVVKSNLSQILGTALTETAGQIAAAFKKFFDKAAPTGTVNSLPDAVAGATGGLFIAGTNAATSVTTALTANITGNVSGSVGSVTTDIGKYMHGAVWIDTVNGEAGTSSYVNGIPSRPCSTIASAKTIGDNLKLKRFWTQAGSAITLGADFVGYIFDGRGYSLALDGRNVSTSQFERIENLTGTGTCATGEAIFYDCHVGAVTIGEADFTRCHLNGTITMAQASVPYLFHGCAGVASAKITFAAASQSAVVAKWSGALTIAGMVSTNTLYLDGDGEVTIDNTNTAGTVYLSGNIKLTNNGSGQTIVNTNDASIISELAKVPKSDSTVSWNNTALAAINAEVVDALGVDTIAEMTQGAPPASPTIKQVLNYLYRKFRNKVETTATETKIYDDAGTTVLIKETHGEAGGTFTKGEFGTGA